MKRVFLACLLSALFAGRGSGSTNPPVAELTGWQVRGPSGDIPLVDDPAPPALPSQGPLSAEQVMQALSLSRQPASGTETAAIDLGLSTLLPPDSYELLAETARGLQCGEWTWLQCYLFVRDNIRYTPYRGISRGPVRTLIDREGNDADQSLLLAALLKANGFSATVCYSGRLAYPNDSYFSFRMPLGGTANNYDAEHLLGVSSDGTAYGAALAVFNILQPSGVPYAISIGETPQESFLYKEHFCVCLYGVQGGLYLDPSVKPRLATPPSDTLAADMGYARASLLAAAGGVTNGFSVQGLDAASLSNELSRLSANLSAAWREAAPGAPARDFIGGDEIVPQNLANDAYLMHGTFVGATASERTPKNFLTMSGRNNYRSRLKVIHGSATNDCWLDELGARTLWMSYTNDTESACPRALIHLDGSNIASEAVGFSAPGVQALVAVFHPSIGQWHVDSYSVHRAATNLYVIPVGFGSAGRGGMRDLTAGRLAAVKGEDLPEDDARVRVAVLHSLGQQWLHQCALVNAMCARLGGSIDTCLYDIGIVGQETSSYFDFKTGAICTTRSAAPDLPGRVIFDSALEHGVLDQCNGPERPAVSTVRLLRLANDPGEPIYLATSSNWQTVESSLTNYPPDTLAFLGTNVLNGQKFLLPRDGLVILGQWSGPGFFSFGPHGSSALIARSLGGGWTAFPGLTALNDALDNMTSALLPDRAVEQTLSSDPVDMFSGAAVIGRTDLALSGPSPLVWRRHYDSRRRGLDGAVGRGWSHGYGSRVAVHANPDAFLGAASPAACAASAVACAVVDDLLSAGESALNLTVAALVADWWAGQLLGSGATVTADGEALAFTRLPDNTYEPAPGVTASLSRDGDGRFALRERLGRTWTFAADGALSQIEDPSGNLAGLAYGGMSNLVAVTNSFGSRLDVAWENGRVSAVSDNAGRSVSYAYGPDGCLTGVTDAAGEVWETAYDAEGAFVSETDPSGVPTVRNAYNALGQVTNQLSASGHSWTFAYAAGTRSWEADPFGFKNFYGFTDEGRQAWSSDRNDHVRYASYDPRGHLVTNLDALGRLTVSAFDASNRLTRVTEAAATPDERTTAFAYDGRHRLVAITNAMGRVTRMGYDGHDRLVCVTAPDGVTVTNVYNARGLWELTRTLDAAGNVVRETSAVYNGRGLPEEVTSTDAGTTLYRYDAAGNATNITDALGRSLALSYNARRQLTGTADALGHTTARLYTPEGRLYAAVDALGRTNRFLWTPGGKPAAVIYPDGGVSTNEYDIADRMWAVRDPRGNRISFGLDPAGRVTNRMAAAWSDAAWYDAEGCVIARVDAVSGLTENGYDNLDRPVAVTDPMGGAWTNTYDAAGALTGGRDPRGRTTAYARDLVGRLAATTYPSGRIEGNGYDALGRLTSFTNAEGRVTRMSYDAQGRMTAATNALGERVFRNLYDLVGNLTNRVDAASRRTEFKYDALNRLTTTDYSDGAWERFGYDAVNNLTAASNAASRLAFGYDAMNRLSSSETRVAGQVFGVNYAYDLGGLVTSRTLTINSSLLTVHYSYDADGRVINVTDWAGRSWTFSRDAAGRLTALSYPNGVAGAWAHDARHSVASWSYASGATPIAGRTITRDEAGVKTKEQVTAGLFPNPQNPRRSANVFDTADRLVSATVAVGTNTFSETYLYDGNGALTNKQSAIGNGQYEYDCAGRMTFASAGNATLSVTYDALGNRLTTYAANATRIWITDHADPRKRPLMEADAYGVPIRYFIWGGGLLLAVVEADGTIRYAHSDEQGSVVALTDDSGAVTDQYCYGPFGTDWGHSGTNSIPFRWLGSHGVFNVDGSALHLTRYRAYDASLCRFLSQDPLGLGGGPNLYAYCMGNPLAYIDPLGLCGESVIASVGDFLADMFLNKGDIVNAWELVSGADYHKSRGWLEGAFGTVGLLALTADAAFNVVPGKAAVEAGIKTGIKEVAEAGAKAFAKDVAGEIAEKAAKSADKFSRTPKSLMDEMVLDAAKKGKGNLIIENLNDPKFKGMDKWRYGEKSTQGLNSEVHYVGDPKTGELMDFKFKHHAEIFR